METKNANTVKAKPPMKPLKNSSGVFFRGIKNKFLTIFDETVDRVLLKMAEN